MNKNELLLLRSLLPFGYRKIIQERTNYSYPLIDQVLSGRRYNQKVVDCAIQIYKETVQAKLQSAEALTNLLSASI
jgi:hypothetical protein